MIPNMIPTGIPKRSPKRISEVGSQSGDSRSSTSTSSFGYLSIHLQTVPGRLSEWMAADAADSR